MTSIRLQTQIAAPVEPCFALSLSVDAHTRSMGDFGEQVVGGVRSSEMKLGDSVTWRARHFAIPFTMTLQITALESPSRFVDEQASGPFGHWWQEHRFEPVGAGTSMTDVVHFASPLGPVGRLVDRLVLERYMTRLLRQRNNWLAEAAGSSA